MTQSRHLSFIEAAVNVVIGYGLAVAVQVVIFPVLGLQATLSQNLALGTVFTAASLGRSYALRHVFARLS